MSWQGRVFSDARAKQLLPRLTPALVSLQAVTTRMQLIPLRLHPGIGRPQPLPTRISALRNRLHPVLLRQRLASESKNATVNSKPETGTEAEARYARADTGAADSL